MAAPSANKYTVVHMRAGSRPFRISSDIGTQVPLPWTASGRLLLSHLDASAIQAIVRPEDLVLPGGCTIEFKDFIDAVEAARRDGYCITSGLIDAYTHCVAAPVLDQNGHAVATLCFVVPVDTARDRLLELRDILIESGRALSLMSMGARGADELVQGSFGSRGCLENRRNLTEGYDVTDPDMEWGFGDGPIDARKTTLLAAIEDSGAKSFKYLYDFGTDGSTRSGSNGSNRLPPVCDTHA